MIHGNLSLRELDKLVTELSRKYMDIISGVHHKDRDCHWFITRKWSYGSTPIWYLEHDGYLYDFPYVEYKSFREALEGLHYHISEAIEEAEDYE